MKISQGVVGVAALVQGTALAVLLVFIAVVLPRLGITGSDLFTPAKILPAIHSPVLLVFYALFLSFGVTLLVIVLGLKDLLPSRERNLMRVATLTAVAGLIAYDSFAIVGIRMVSAARPDSAAAASVASSLALLHALLTIAPVAAVTTTAVWGWAAARAHTFPAALCYLIIGASLLRLVTIFTQLPLLVLFQLGGSAVWGWWLGVELLHQQAGTGASVTISARSVSRSGQTSQPPRQGGFAP